MKVLTEFKVNATQNGGPTSLKAPASMAPTPSDSSGAKDLFLDWSGFFAMLFLVQSVNIL